MKLYHHKTSGGAEYLTDTFIPWKHNGKSGKEGTVTDKTTVIVRIDGDITKDAEINGKRVNAYDELLDALKVIEQFAMLEMDDPDLAFQAVGSILRTARAAIAHVEGE